MIVKSAISDWPNNRVTDNVGDAYEKESACHTRQ